MALLFATLSTFMCLSLTLGCNNPPFHPQGRQSPINITPDNILEFYSGQILFENYSKMPRNMSMKIGHETATIYPHVVPPATCAPYRFDYHEFVLLQIHFHWSTSDDAGTEHLFDGKGKALEMHVVHKDLDGEILVLAYLFSSSPNAPDNELNTISDELLRAVRNNVTQVEIPAFPLNYLIPIHFNTYYQYQGSLTTSPYSENVTFLLPDVNLTANARAIGNFRKASQVNPNIGNNVRCIQPINKRKVAKVHITPTAKTRSTSRKKFLWRSS